jgi:hypothetical protein
MHILQTYLSFDIPIVCITLVKTLTNYNCIIKKKQKVEINGKGLIVILLGWFHVGLIAGLTIELTRDVLKPLYIASISYYNVSVVCANG